MTWQPIDTAPRDRTKILLYQPDGMWKKRRGPHRGEAIEVGYWFQPGGTEDVAAGLWVPTMRPTHWMALPEPPPVLAHSAPPEQSPRRS